MSLQMSLVFATLMFEMLVLVAFILPLPLVVRQRFIDGVDLLRKLKNFQVGCVFTTVLLVMQFYDCLNRLNKYDYVSNPYYTTTSAADHKIRTPLTSEQVASKFYSQRNLYITGAVLYLELAIATVLPILRRLVAKETEYRKLSAAEKATLSNTGTTEKEKLQKLIAAKDLDIATFKKQIKGLQSSYDQLTTSEPVDKKSL